MPDGDVPPEAGWAGEPRMPLAVRTARVIALRMAGMGIACTAAAGWLFGTRSAVMTGLGFVPSWLLGLIALTFGAVGGGIRIGAILLSGLTMVWTVSSIATGHPPGWLGPVASVLLVVLLLRRSAAEWFEPGGR